ncbi:hypothetical protein Gotri_006405, partial [Gossypium trilobum]|nr:hypothetical protein [Gossypium trilobum]
ENCNGCGIKCWRGAFRCGKCRFTLNFGWLTLSHSALHKIDEHMLNLTYHDDKEQSYCDICEQERDPSLWATLNAFIVISFAKKKFSSVKSLHAIISSTANAVGVTKPKPLW